MSECEYSQQLHAWFDGELDAERGQVVQQHLTTCAACTEELNELRGISRLVGHWQPELMRMDAMRRIHAEIDRQNWHRMERLAGRLVAMAASIAIIAMIWPAQSQTSAKLPAQWEQAAVAMTDDSTNASTGELAMAQWMVDDLSAGGLNRD